MANKLELNWAGKDDGYALVRDEETGVPVQVPYGEVQPRLMVEAARYGDKTTDNILISGENLYALKTLVKSGYAGKIKCIYIDPPFNTGQAFEHYDDALEHSLWLTMMRDRLELLMDLLADSGSIWITLDDSEVHYLKALCDEIFGRANFVTSVVWRSADSSNNDAKQFSIDHNTILIYSKLPEWKSFQLERTEASNAHYSNPDNDPRGDWFSGNVSSPHPRANLKFNVVSPTGHVIPPPANGWRWSKESIQEKIATGEIVFSADGTKLIRKTYLADQKGLAPSTLWADIDDTGHNRQAKYELKKLFPDTATSELFATPKPERLIRKVLNIATMPGDIVLDCFAGSGTTGAVALKMNRRFIMIEAGDHCDTHIVPRLRKVIEGTDQGGISPIVAPHPSRAVTDKNITGERKPQVGWTGGGGFRYYTLGKSLLERDAETGVWRLNYVNGRLIEAVCLQEGFKLLGRGNYHGVRGRHYAHITETIVTQDYIEALAAELAGDESLTLYCTKAKRNLAVPDSVQLKRIPRDLLPGSPVKSVRQAEVATA